MKFRSIALALAAVVSIGSLSAQKDGKKDAPKSPPAEMTQKVGEATITINYSQPSVKGREIYGNLVPYGKVWRTGANNATTFTTDKDVMINGKKLAAGTYSLFTIPGEKEWTIIFNSEAEQWGAYKYDEEKDALRVMAAPTKNAATEMMTFTKGKNGMIYLDWAEVRVPLEMK